MGRNYCPEIMNAGLQAIKRGKNEFIGDFYIGSPTALPEEEGELEKN